MSLNKIIFSNLKILINETELLNFESCVTVNFHVTHVTGLVITTFVPLTEKRKLVG